jgi:hypothetical protein
MLHLHLLDLKLVHKVATERVAHHHILGARHLKAVLELAFQHVKFFLDSLDHFLRLRDRVGMEDSLPKRADTLQNNTAVNKQHQHALPN